MARPQKNNVDYFPHYLSDGKKMFFIEQKYGNDGYASWFKILEKLAGTDYHYLNLNDESELMYLSAKCRISEDTLVELLTDLAKLGAINDELWASKIIWSDKFIESIQDAYLKRSNDCQSLTGLRVHLHGLGVLKGYVKPQSKEKESKEKESKEKQILYPWPTHNFINAWSAWKDYKKSQHKFIYKKISTEQAALTELNKLTDSETVAIQIINQSIGNGWKGFFQIKNYSNAKTGFTQQFGEYLAKNDPDWKNY